MGTVQTKQEVSNAINNLITLKINEVPFSQKVETVTTFFSPVEETPDTIVLSYEMLPTSEDITQDYNGPYKNEITKVLADEQCRKNIKMFNPVQFINTYCESQLKIINESVARNGCDNGNIHPVHINVQNLK